MLQEEGYPVARSCVVLGLARSSFYHRPRRPDEGDLEKAIEAVVREFPTYGSRRVTAQLRREGWQVNRKRVQRVMRRLGLLQPRKRKGCRTTQSRHPHPRFPNLIRDLRVTHPDQVWVSDLTYVRLREGWVYLAVILDVYTRQVRGWELGRSLNPSLTLTALERALRRGTPEIHHSDQGVQYACPAYVERLQAVGAQISMAERGCPHQNGYVERLIRTIKEEEVELSDYRDFAEAYEQMGHFLEEVYAKKRIHSALGYLTPEEFEAAWRQNAQPERTEENSLPTREPKAVQL